MYRVEYDGKEYHCEPVEVLPIDTRRGDLWPLVCGATVCDVYRIVGVMPDDRRPNLVAVIDDKRRHHIVAARRAITVLRPIGNTPVVQE